jgi:hypothetical protein
MSLIDKGNGVWNVVVEDSIYAINELESHTATMLNDFKTDAAKLAQFESLMVQHGAPTAYYMYNNIPLPISLIEG